MIRYILDILFILAGSWAIWDKFTDKTFGMARASDWATWRKQHIEKECRCCGKKGTFLNRLELHHIKPFHEYPELEKNENNVITLCRRCHLLIGHLDSFKSFNLQVGEDSAYLRDKIANRP